MNAMTDFETMKQMLDRVGVPYHAYEATEESPSHELIICWSAPDEPRFIFDIRGALVRVEAW
jgi:hypothetical protein